MTGSARYWREVPQRYRYEAGKCKQCGKVFFPPRVVCHGCRGQAFDNVELARTGRVETYTVIRVAPSGFATQAPYAVGIIRLDDGVKITAQIVDCDVDKIDIGDPVKLEFRKLQEDGESGILCYGYKFVPAT